MNLIQLKNAIAALRTKAHSLKTKRAKERVWIKVRDLEREALNILYAARDTYSTHSIKAVVQHCSVDGDEKVLARTANGDVCWFDPTSDEISKSWYSHTCCVTYVKNQTVVLEIEVDVDADRLCLQANVKRVHGGTLDESKYAELSKRTDLAFFKYPTGMSGLFP